MQISFISHEYPPVSGGGSTALHEYASGLATRGHAVQVVTVGTGAHDTVDTEDGVQVVRLAAGRKSLLAPSKAELIRSCAALRLKSMPHLRRHEPEVLVAFFAFPAGFLAAPLAAKLNIPLVVSLRGSDVPGFSAKRLGVFGPLLPYLFRRATRHAAAVVPNGRRLADMAAPYLHTGSRVRVIPNGVDTLRFAPQGAKHGSMGGPLRVLFVGQMIARKQCLVLAQALHEVAARGVPLQVSFAGSGPLEQDIRRIVSSLDPVVGVTFTGHVPRNAIADLYGAHDVLVHLSQAEGVSNVLMEALSSGLCLVAADTAVDAAIDGVPRQAPAEDGGIILLPVDCGPVVLGATLAGLACNRSLVEEQQRLARRTALKNSWQVRVGELEDLLTGSIAGCQAS
jgi:glycosyltransferase involved in cell wall biosynthesis